MSGIDYCYLLQEVTDVDGNRCSGGPVKIGHGKDPNARFFLCQTGNSRELRQCCLGPGGKQLEAEFMKAWAHLRIRKKSEWFKYDPKMLGWLIARGCRPTLRRYRRIPAAQ